MNNFFNKFIAQFKKVFNLKKYLILFQSYYTWLAVLVFGIILSLLILIINNATKYSRPDYWNWKKRSLYKCIYIWIILILIKVLI